MSKIITIKEANISTLAVELKAIHINSKQMTLSVFRQIQEEDYFDKDFIPNGVAWGLINYFWDKSYQFNNTVLHLVWQKGSELRRWRLSNIMDRSDSHGSRPFVIDSINYNFYGKEEGELARINGFLEGRSYYAVKDELFSEYENTCNIHRPQYYEKNGAFKIQYPDSKEDWAIKRNNELIRKYEISKKYETKCLIRKPILENLIIAKKIDAQNYIENWRKSYQQIASLPQLYIAA